MWNSLVKGVTIVAFIVVLALTVRTAKIKSRRINFFFLAMTGVVIIALSLFRIENIFYSFPTAGSVAEYACTGDVLGIAEGENSSMIVYSDGAVTLKTMIAPRRASGYKIGIDIDTKIIASDYTHEYAVEVLGNTGGDDYYILVYGTSDVSEVSIEDSDNSKFITSTKEIVAGSREYTKLVAFAFLDEYTAEYAITITSGEKTVTVKIEDKGTVLLS